MEAREGDIIEIGSGIFFDVKGLVHPPNQVIAFIRYIPNLKGNRNRYGKRYSKFYSLSKRYRLLKREYPQYLVDDPVFNTLLCEVPVEDIRKHYQPSEGLLEIRRRIDLDQVETIALKFLQILKEKSRVPWSNLGISGSILIKLHRPESDIDLVVYGSKMGYMVQKTMKEMLENKKSPIKAYDFTGLKELFDFRSKDTIMSFEDFVRSESRKVSQGKFLGKHFFIRFVKDLNEIKEQYGSTIYKPIGNIKIKAEVMDDSQAIFTPCTYNITNVRILRGPQVDHIEEIVSYRGRFCEQAKNGEKVIAEGEIERVKQEGKDDYFRVLLGSKRSDHMIII